MISDKQRLELAALQFQAFDYVPVGAFAIDKQWNVVYWNRLIEQWSGVRASKILGAEITEFFPNLKDSTYVGRIQEIFDGGPPTLFSSQLHGHLIPAPLPNGKLRLQDTTVAGAVPLDGGSDRFALFIIQDVTDLADSLQSAQESGKQYRRIIEQASDIVYTIDLEGCFTFVNRPAEILTGFSQAELLGMHFSELLPEEEIERVIEFYDRQRTDLIKETLLEFTLMTKSGERLWVEQRVVLVQEGGQYSGMQSILRDISERKAVEQALSESENRYRTLFEASSEAIVLSREGVVLEVNPVFENMFGFKQGTVAGMHTAQFMAEESHATLRQHMESQDPGPYELVGLRRDGTKFPIEARASHLMYQGNDVRVTALRDLTSYKRTEAALQAARDDLELRVEERTRELEQANVNLQREIASRQEVQKQADQQNRDLGLINELNRAVNSGASLTELFELLAEHIKAVFTGIGATIYLLDDSRNELVLQNKPWSENIRQKLASLTGIDFPPSRFSTDSPVGNALHAGETRLIDTAAEINDWLRGNMKSAVFPSKGDAKKILKLVPAINDIIGVKSMLVLPMLGDDGPMGLMIVSRATQLEDEEVTRLELLSKQLTILIRRKQVDEKLALTDTIISNVPSIVLVSAENGEIIFASPSVETVLGYTPQEVLGSGWFDLAFIDKESADRMRKYLAGASSATTGLRQESYERISFDRDGNPHHILWQDAKGPGSLLIGIGYDITGSKASQASLLKLSSAIEQTADAVIVTDSQGVIEFVNPAFETLTGYSAAEAMGKTPALLKSGQHKREFYADLWQIILAGKPFHGEFVNKKKNGELFIEAKTIAPIRDVEGKITHFISTGRDITHQKEAENILALERERLSITLQGLADGVITTDDTGQIVLMNPAAESLTGWDQAAALGQMIGQVFKSAEGEEQLDQIICALAAEGSAPFEESELDLATRAGSQVPVEFSVSQLRGPDGALMGNVVVFHDISAKKQLDIERVRTQKMESLGTLAGGLAHDFNNFLMTIMLNIGTARLKIDDPAVLKLLEDAETSVDRAKGITQQLLTFSRGGEPVKTLMDLRPLITESSLFALRGTAVTARIDLPAELPLVEADSGQLNQVISNLVINAVHAMPKGGQLKITARAEHMGAKAVRGDRAPGLYIEVLVADEGVGISPGIIDSIFDPYFTTRSTGSGLGLSSCYSIIEKHGGWITVESEVDRGSTFRFYLPAKESVLDKAIAEPVPALGPGRILVMDDDDAIRLALKSLLGIMGFETIVTSNGSEAITAFRAAHEAQAGFSAVILDITVPGGMGGVDTIQGLLDIDPEARVIVSSGYATDPVMANFSDYGFKAVLPKPFKPENLSQVLGKVLA